MHVPEENLPKYRALRSIADRLDNVANAVSGLNGKQGKLDANILWSMAGVYRAQMMDLRVESPLVTANKAAACHHCGGGIGEFKASATRGNEERFFCHNDERSCYNERRGNYFD